MRQARRRRGLSAICESWTAPGGQSEYCLRNGADPARAHVCVLPAWFDEHNKLRHFTAEVVRLLGEAGVAASLPDLPGVNESLARLEAQDLDSWRAAAESFVKSAGCNHILTIRAAAAIAPELPGWAYAPVPGKSALRALLRARVLASKEAGREEKSDALMALGAEQGLELGGYRLGPRMVAQLAAAELAQDSRLTTIAQGQIGGAGLWLRAEPDHDPAQAKALVDRILADLAA